MIILKERSKLKLKQGLSKFNGYVRERGWRHALGKGFSYMVFLIRKWVYTNIMAPEGWQAVEKVCPSQKISSGKLDILFYECGVKFFYNRYELTHLGLNTAVHSLGLWTDSSKAEWSMLENGGEEFKFKVSYKELRLHQIWTVEILSEKKIRWKVVTEFEEQMHINETRYVCLMRACYKSWFCDYRISDIPRPDRNWHSLCLEDQTATMVGARFPVRDNQTHAFSIETREGVLFPVVQGTPSPNGALIVGFRTQGRISYKAKEAMSFSALITLYDSPQELDEKMERLRQEAFWRDDQAEKKADRKTPQFLRGKRPSALLLNLPWRDGSKRGVRAGSRWPHLKDESEGLYTPFPFFLAYAASLLRKNNMDALVIDAVAEKITERGFMERVLSSDADYFIIETSVPSFNNDLKFIKKLSQTGKFIVLCGPHAEIYNTEFLEKHEFVDFVLCGEYEFTLLELIRHLQDGRELSGIAGLIYRDRGKAVKNPPREPSDINLLPWPDRTMAGMEYYWDLPGDIPYPSVQMLASRGCSFGCSFCLWPQVMYGGNHYRVRDLEDVLDEMEYLVREKHYRSVYFDDDTFNIGKERMLEFCKLLKDRGLHKVPWAIMARADLMDEQILREMKSAGLFAVKYGVESPDKFLLEESGKKMDLDKTTRMIKFTRSLGIKVHLTFCFGFMRETEESIQKTVRYAIACDPDSVQFSILTPFPGTALFDELDRSGKILTKNWDEYDGHQNCIFKPDLLTPQALVQAKKDAYKTWGEHRRKKTRLSGRVKAFLDLTHSKGLKHSLAKTYAYLRYSQKN